MDMRVLDTDGNELAEGGFDLELGRLVTDTVVVKHHPETEYREAKGHLAYTVFYFDDGTSYSVQGEDDPHVGPDGWVNLPGEPERSVFGAEQELVVDEPEVEARPAHDDVEDVLRYIPYTEEELEAVRAAKEREEMLEGMPAYQESQDDALCALYELSEEQRKTIEQQDDAICALYEMIGA